MQHWAFVRPSHLPWRLQQCQAPTASMVLTGSASPPQAHQVQLPTKSYLSTTPSQPNYAWQVSALAQQVSASPTKWNACSSPVPGNSLSLKRTHILEAHGTRIRIQAWHAIFRRICTHFPGTRIPTGVITTRTGLKSRSILKTL